jgi:Protein of unknown function (DUF4235)
MANVAGKMGMRLLTVVIGLPVGILARKAVEKKWEAARPFDPPPKKIKESGVDWADAIAWGVLSATGMVVADMITRKSAESTYRVLTGNEPPPAAPKASKKVKKAKPATTELAVR